MSSATETPAAVTVTTATGTTTTTTTTTTNKKGVKIRCGHAAPDFAKLRQELRQRCKQRIKERREELFNQHRFGVSSNSDVEVKLKEIFEEELVDLVTDETSELEKHIDSKQLIDELRTELEESIAEGESKLTEKTADKD